MINWLRKNYRKNKKAILFVGLSFLGWRVWLQAFLLLGWFVLPLRERFLGGGMKNFLIQPGLWPWANFDGEHYLAIAHHGYGNLEQAFFPLFPWLIRVLAFRFKESLFALLVSGLTISNLSFLIALFLLYLLIRLDFKERVAQLSILFLLAFPGSFFLGAVYSESLFLVLILGAFYAARKKQWWVAGILGALASGTRVVGILLLPALLWEWWEQNKEELAKYKRQDIVNLIPLFLIPLGLLFYMRFLASYYQDPLMFAHVHPEFGAGRTVDKLIMLYQVFWRYLKMIATTRWDPLYFTVWLEFLTAAGFGALLIFSWFKKIRFSYLIFAALAYIAPTLTGTFLSMPRLVLILFPCFIALALIKNKFFRIFYFGVCILLLIISTIFFTRGYWIG